MSLLSRIFSSAGLCAGISALASAPPASAADRADEEITVIASTPLHGVGLDQSLFAGSVQTLDAKTLGASHTLDLSSALDRRLGAVSLSNGQNNVLQPDLSYRGFTASPLLGVPQGIAVYLDGMRVNEAFGDTVNWDLLPESSIESLNVISGSNPVFGLNTLGGAISLESKNGFNAPGYHFTGGGGSFDRTTSSGEFGANDGTLGVFLDIDYLDEAGWRDASPSNAKNIGGALSYRDEKTSVDLHYRHGETSLVGNGAVPVQFSMVNPRGIFTSPDRTENELDMLNLVGNRWITDELQFSGNVYYRNNTTNSFNGDDSPYVADFVQSVPGIADPFGTGSVDQAFCTSVYTQAACDTIAAHPELLRAGAASNGTKGSLFIGSPDRMTDYLRTVLADPATRPAMADFGVLPGYASEAYRDTAIRESMILTEPDNIRLDPQNWEYLAFGNAMGNGYGFTSLDGTGTPAAVVGVDGGAPILLRDQHGNFIRDPRSDDPNYDIAECDALTGQDFLDCKAAMRPYYDAVNNISVRKQRSFGTTLQTTALYPVLGRQNQMIAGFAYDRGLVDFQSAVELAHLNPDRSTTRSGVYVADDAVRLKATTHTLSGYFTDTLSITKTIALTLSGRFNSTHVIIRDRLGNNPDLNGSHSFSRFNPGVGVTWNPLAALGFFASYNESSRAPTAVELTCANPEASCRLPNAFLADPPLEQVVASSYEIGARGALGARSRWMLTLFTTTSKDDILFQSTGGSTSNVGFFDNVGDTRRQGLEFGFSTRFDRASMYFNYAYVDATFRDSFRVSSPTHGFSVRTPYVGLASSATCTRVQDVNILQTGIAGGIETPFCDLGANGALYTTNDIQVNKGDRLPLVPEHTLKIGGELMVVPDRWTLGLDMVANSDRFMRGDESNQLRALAGYATFNLHSVVQLHSKVALIAIVENLLDKGYSSAGLLGEPNELGGAFAGFTNPAFVSRAAPRAAWMAVQVKF